MTDPIYRAGLSARCVMSRYRQTTLFRRTRHEAHPQTPNLPNFSSNRIDAKMALSPRTSSQPNDIGSLQTEPRLTQ